MTTGKSPNHLALPSSKTWLKPKSPHAICYVAWPPQTRWDSTLCKCSSFPTSTDPPVLLLKNSCHIYMSPNRGTSSIANPFPQLNSSEHFSSLAPVDECIPQHQGLQAEKRLIVGSHNHNDSIYSSSERWLPLRRFLVGPFCAEQRKLLESLLKVRVGGWRMTMEVCWEALGIMLQTGLLLNLPSNKYLWKSHTENAINPFSMQCEGHFAHRRASLIPGLTGWHVMWSPAEVNRFLSGAIHDVARQMF